MMLIITTRLMKTCAPCSRHYVTTYAFIAMFFFLVSYLWQYALNGADLKALHEQLMRMAILGYTGHNAMSLLLGLMQSAVWGAVFGGIYSIFEQGRSCEECNINVILE